MPRCDGKLLVPRKTCFVNVHMFAENGASGSSRYSKIISRRQDDASSLYTITALHRKVAINLQLAQSK